MPQMIKTAQNGSYGHIGLYSSRKNRGVKINLLITTTPHIFLPFVVNTPLYNSTTFANFSIPPL